LIPHLPFDPQRAAQEARELNPELKIFTVSSVTGEGIQELSSFLIEKLKELRTIHA